MKLPRGKPQSARSAGGSTKSLPDSDASDGDADGDTGSGFVRAFARGIDVIEALGSRTAGSSIATVADATGLSRAAARRLLLTLVERRLAATDGKLFTLEPRVLNLGLAYLNTLPYWPYAQPALEDLRARTDESCGMAVLDGGHIVFVMRIPAHRILAMNANIGTRLPAHCVSMGQVLLAGLDDEEFEAFASGRTLERATPSTLTSLADLKTRIEQVRARGYAWVDGELDPAVCGIAVPLKNRAGRTIAAINVSLTAGAWDEDTARRKLLSSLRETAERIRSAMGVRA